jgi:2-polyprenyl-6-methoxyphenol hydroxylase-like FAD-dependent oxidoreductase
MAVVSDVAIIGGGIGGMTLAAMLQRAGVQATVYEQAPEITEVGAGIVVWSGPAHTLARLGLADDLAAIGQRLDSGAISTYRGQDLTVMAVETLRQQHGHDLPNHIVHRAELLAMIATAVYPNTIRTSSRCLAVAYDGAKPVATFADGTQVTADLIVGADGLHSAVRDSLWGRRIPDYAGEVCWRAVATIDWPDAHRLREVQGPGRRFGICPLTQGRVYWWATEQAAPDLQVPVADRQAHLEALFGDWPFGIGDLIAATPADRMLCHPLYDRRRIPQWHRGAVTLIGDAAHPTTPNLGQGANMAMEDAAWLARCLLSETSLERALQRYEWVRLPFHARIVSLSRVWGDVGQWRHPLAVAFREASLRLSAPLSRKSFAEQMRSGMPRWPQPT